MRAYVLARSLIAAHREAEAVLEVEPTHLAVARDVEADRLLQGEMLAHAVELDLREFGGAELPGLELGPRLLPFRRPQQAADDVRTDTIERRHHSCRTPAAFTAWA